MTKSVLLHGGGLDSTAVLVCLSKDVYFDVMHIDYGHVAAVAERLAIQKQCRRYGLQLVCPEMPEIRRLNTGPSQLFSGNNEEPPIVEGRNLLLIMKAVMRGYDTIYLGLDKPASGTAWPDASLAFVTSMNHVLAKSFLNRKVRVIAPFIHVDKTEVFRRALAIDPELFEMSATCWTPINDQPCGVCKHCNLQRTYKEELNV